MTLDQYLANLHRRRRSLMARARVGGDIRGLALLRAWQDVRVCCSPDWHRREWKYKGSGRFVCDVCRRIAV